MQLYMIIFVRKRDKEEEKVKNLSIFQLASLFESM